MAAPDTNIILDAGNIQGPNPDALISMFSLAQQVQQAKAEQGKKNALLSVFSDPNSVDLTTGTPTPQAIRKVLAVDPEMGLKLQDDALSAQVKHAELQHSKTEQGQANWNFMTGAAGIGYDAYDAAKKNGKSEADAVAAGQTARNEAVKNNGGVIGDDVADGIISKPFDPNGAKALALSNKEYATTYNQAKVDEERNRHDAAIEDNTRRGQDIHIDTQQAGKWQILTDPGSKDAKGNPVQYRYNVEDPSKSTTLDGSAPYTPSGAAKLGGAPAAGGEINMDDPGDKSYIESIANYRVAPPSSGRNPAQRKAIIEAALKVNPDYQEGRYAEASKALRDFGTGKQGDIARSLNVSVSHLDTLRDLGKALDNGDVKLINAAKQRFAEEFSVPAPTNFDAAKAIVADEVAKGVIGGQSAQSDRETLAASLRRSGGYQAIDGAINTFQTLLGGQLGGLRDQYKRTTGAKDFDQAFLSEKTRKALGVKDGSAGTAGADGQKIAAPASKADYDALPSGAHYSKPGDAPGTYRVKP